MPRKRILSTPIRPYGQSKRGKHFRLRPEIIQRLEKAAARFAVSQAAYVESALAKAFDKDGIL